MSGLSQYLLSVTMAAIISAVIGKLFPAKGATTKMGKILCGFFLLFTVLHPLTDIQLEQWEDFVTSIRIDAQQAAESGNNIAKKEWESIITERITTYILDKAETYDAQLTVTVQLSQESIPMPVSIEISGNISPYGKRQMQAIIAEDFGIPEEAQIWT